MGHDLATSRTRAGAYVENVIGRANGVFIMLDHDHAITELPERTKGSDQPIIVALMQADTRFVEDVEDAAARPEPIWVARRIR